MLAQTYSRFQPIVCSITSLDSCPSWTSFHQTLKNTEWLGHAYGHLIESFLPTCSQGKFFSSVFTLAMRFDMQIFSCQLITLKASQEPTGSTDCNL